MYKLHLSPKGFKGPGFSNMFFGNRVHKKLFDLSKNLNVTVNPTKSINQQYDKQFYII
jgi:hypothetical protein